MSSRGSRPGKKLSQDKDLDKYLRTLRKAGWDVTYDGKNHLRLTSPAGIQLRCASSPGDHNAVHVVKRLVRQRSSGVTRRVAA